MYVTLPNHLFEDAQTLKDGFPTDQTHHVFATRTVPAGHFLFREGDESCNVYEIMDGVVRASKLLGDGRRQIIAFGYPRDILGISHDCRYHSDCEA
ncbi:MAG: cyclic nucleotide-binding domain-containing protein, partial [Pseudomonadota bacterium]